MRKRFATSRIVRKQSRLAHAFMRASVGKAIDDDYLLQLDNLTMLLDATKITGLVDTDPVATWEDQSGNSNDASQGTAANRALYRTNILNGLPAVRFDGINDYYTVTFGSDLVQPTTIITVATHGDNTDFFYDGIVNTKRHTLHGTAAPGNPLVAYAGAVLDSTVNSEFPASVFSVLYNGANGYIRRNSTELIAGNIGAQVLSGLTIGADYATSAGRFLDGDIYQMLVIDGELDTNTLINTERFLIYKWGVAT